MTGAAYGGELERAATSAQMRNINFQDMAAVPAARPGPAAGTALKISGYRVPGFPILEALQASGAKLSDNALGWMKKWKGIDLEDTSVFRLGELSGSTSINLKIRKIDPSHPKGGKSYGSFVTFNSGCNPNTEIAYFNLAAILGHDDMFRPAVRYELGPAAQAQFKALIPKTPYGNSNKEDNRKNILAMIASGKPLLGAIKAKKPDSIASYDKVKSGPVMSALKASNKQPRAGEEVTLTDTRGRAHKGDLLVLAREYSIIMTLDAVFQQWDRYSGGNVTIREDDDGKTHFYSTDNGGAGLTAREDRVKTNLDLFSRYDRGVIDGLRKVSAFLDNPSQGFLGYTNTEAFMTDLGFYAQKNAYAAHDVKLLNRNLKLLFEQVDSVKAKYGDAAFLE